MWRSRAIRGATGCSAADNARYGTSAKITIVAPAGKRPASGPCRIIWDIPAVCPRACGSRRQSQAPVEPIINGTLVPLIREVVGAAEDAGQALVVVGARDRRAGGTLLRGRV